jgi:hypothetical protein
MDSARRQISEKRIPFSGVAGKTDSNAKPRRLLRDSTLWVNGPMKIRWRDAEADLKERGLAEVS